MNLLLIGLRGSGKSTIGRKLARRLARDFVDLDDLTPGEAGEATVTDVFTKQGEPAFRAAEARALAQALSRDRQVIALGGGTPTAPGAAELLRKARADGRARLIYLRASAATLRMHLKDSHNAHRPSLTGRNILDEIDDLLAQRDGPYRAIADVIIETDGRARGEVLRELEAEATK
ncbi:MAG: AAA family ATPase [Phycisphaerales bacterium]|nr:AAA family ATPase [Phycisphaerales bacterium]